MDFLSSGVTSQTSGEAAFHLHCLFVETIYDSEIVTSGWRL